METIDPARVQRALQAYVGDAVYLHLETTHGAYTRGGFGAFARNVRVHLEAAAVRGRGPYRVGLRVMGGWVYAEGLTHWWQEPDRVLLEGHDDEDRLTVVLEVARRPFPLATDGGTADRPATTLTPRQPPEGEREPAPAPETMPVTATDPVPAPWDRHLVVVLAHPDDESFGAAGTMARAVRQGIGVTMVCVTAGQMGRRVGRPPLANRESLGPLRIEELRRAMAAVGVTDVRVLGVWDKTVEFQDRAQLAGRIRAILEETGATTVITFHPELGGHPDHDAVGAATVEAVAALGRLRPRLLFVKGPLRDADPGLPVVTVPIAEVRTLKEAAFRAHRSQTTGWDERLRQDEEMARRFDQLLREESFWVAPYDGNGRGRSGPIGVQPS